MMITVEKDYSFSYRVPTPSELDLDFSALAALAERVKNDDPDAINILLEWLALYPQSRFAPRYDYLNWVERTVIKDYDGVVIRNDITRRLRDVWPEIIRPAMKNETVRRTLVSFVGNDWTESHINISLIKALSFYNDQFAFEYLIGILCRLLVDRNPNIMVDKLCAHIINFIPADARLIDLLDGCVFRHDSRIALIRKMAGVACLTDVLIEKLKAIVIDGCFDLEIRLEAISILSGWIVKNPPSMKDILVFIENKGILYPNGPVAKQAAQGYPEEAFPHMGNVGLNCKALRPLRPLSDKINSLPLWGWENNYHRWLKSLA